MNHEPDQVHVYPGGDAESGEGTDYVEPEHETARLAADAVLFTSDSATGRLLVLLVQRKWSPRAGFWGLPGGHLDVGEDDRDAAARECVEETGIRPRHLRYVGSYRAPGRDERYRVASWAWTELHETAAEPTPSDDAAAADWWPVDDVLVDTSMLAFGDHAQMIRDALAVLGITSTGTDLSADSDQLRAVYEERAHWAAVVAACHRERTRLARNDPHEPDLPVLYLEGPTGQISLHVNPDHLPMFEKFAGVEWADGSEGDEFITRWDGHGKSVALARLRRLALHEAAQPTKPPA